MTDGDVAMLLVTGTVDTLGDEFTNLDGSPAELCGSLMVAASFRDVSDSPNVISALSLTEALLFLVTASTGNVVKFDTMLKKLSLIFLTFS